MKAILAPVFALALLSPAVTDVCAQTFNRPVAPTVSVIGAVQVGSGSVAIRQNSTANFAGLVQTGPHVGAVIQQGGAINSGSITQVGRITGAGISQSGGFNSARIGQVGIYGPQPGAFGFSHRGR